MNLPGLIESASSNKKSFILVGVIILIVASVIAYLIISLVMAKRKVQDLYAKQRQADENLKQLQEQYRLAKEAKVQEDIKAQIREKKKEVDGYQTQIKDLEGKRAKFSSDIEGLTSWKDLEVTGPSSPS